MIVQLQLYGTAVSLLFALAGLVMEQLAARLEWPRRGVWAATLLLSIAVPISMVARPHSPHAEIPGFAFDENATPVSSGRHRESIDSSAPTAIQPQGARMVPAYSLPNLDRTVEIAWVALTAVVVAAFVLTWIRLRKARREWRKERIEGQPVWITPALGPAVFGFIRPEILLPQWMVDAPLAARRVVLAHEREHILARDPLLLFVGYLAVLVVPWNLPLWWQLRRLRFAVEVDCDRRVLDNGTAMQTYGEVLLTVSQRRGRAPLGAMAIAKPLSQLERRVRAMTLRRRKPARWLIGVGLTLAAACVACAFDLPAPALRDSALRKPPLHDWSPYLPMAEAAARAAYPDLFQGRFDGTMALVVDLNRYGAILSIRPREFPAGPLPRDASLRDIDELELIPDRVMRVGAQGSKFFGWFGPQHTNGLYLSYVVFNWPYDPERSAARVREAVAKRYPEFFHSYPADAATPDRIGKIVTVFMNDDGTINRAQLSDATQSDIDERKFHARFLALGLTEEQFGHRARTSNYQDLRHATRYPNAPHLWILYAWPRRSDDPPDVTLQSNAVFDEVRQKFEREFESQVPDEIMLKRYFPDVWENAPAKGSDALWILRDEQGEICATGRSAGHSMEITKLLDARYPTARVKDEYSVGAATANGNTTDLYYFRLDDDSPATTCEELANL